MYRLVMRAPDGNDLTITGAYCEFNRPSKLVYTSTWAHVPDQAMVVTVEFRSVEPLRTIVRVTHARIVDWELARYEGGWREGDPFARGSRNSGRIKDA